MKLLQPTGSSRFFSPVSVLLFSALLLGLAACVPSLHPLYTEADLVFDPALIGEWKDQPTDKDSWTFTKADEGKSYHLVVIDNEGKPGGFTAHLLKVDGVQFLDLFPEPPTLAQNDFYKAHLVPVHMFLWVAQVEPTLKLSFLNPDWLKQTLEKNPAALRHEAEDGGILLTAAPKELQKFLLAHLKTPDAFTEPSNLTRQKPAAAAGSAPAPATPAASAPSAP